MGGDNISFSAWNEIQKTQKMFLHGQLGLKSSTSYPIMLLETSAQPINVLVIQRVYRYIAKVMNMLDHRLPRQARNIGCNVQ